MKVPSQIFAEENQTAFIRLDYPFEEAI